jgi:hypothetical protein
MMVGDLVDADDVDLSRRIYCCGRTSRFLTVG